MWLDRTDDATDCRCIGAWNRDQDLVRLPRREDSRQVRPSAEHHDPVNALPDLGAVIVHEANRLILGWVRVYHVADDHLARVTRSPNQNATTALGSPELAAHALRDADAPDEADQQDRIDDEDRA